MKCVFKFMCALLAVFALNAWASAPDVALTCKLYAPGFNLKVVKIPNSTLGATEVNFKGMTYNITLFTSCGDDGGVCGPPNLNVSMQSEKLGVYSSAERRNIFQAENTPGEHVIHLFTRIGPSRKQHFEIACYLGNLNE